MTTLPKVSFCDHQISKLVIGDNPIYGYSHFNQLLSQHQQAYHTPEQVVATLKRAEQVGINAWQNSMTDRSMSDLQRYRDEGGYDTLVLPQSRFSVVRGPRPCF